MNIHFKRFINRFLDVLIPPQCLRCRTIVDDQKGLCPPCWSAIHFINHPFCTHCGAPFAAHVGSDALCDACLRHPPVFDYGRSVFMYDEASKDLILAFKHTNQTLGSPLFGQWMAHQLDDVIKEKIDMIVPVPLHLWRRLRRGYNQAELLAHDVARCLQKPIATHILKRHHATPSQGHLSPDERIKNVENAFCVMPKARDKIRGASILLIDDVWTTGATLNACAKTLRSEGATWIGVLTLARA